ncbi:MAG: Gfo/Idh/MocA family oxidoreductase, partial [Bacteroidota bacterium]|nr:Gfo/Idh/MocA family oxidoreductase [Bacteroidota bacterium]
MSDKIRWGILGCGKIANKFASDLKLVQDAELKAVASRNAARLESFSRQHQAPLKFDSYEGLVTSPDVDVIYVATPHGLHYEHVLLCLNHDKSVLCEKAFALNLRQAREMVQLARNKKVFLMEAFWTRFIPQYKEVMDIVRSGR